MTFYKYHALGNDYLVLDPKESPEVPESGTISRVCDRNYGLGSDGILYGPLLSEGADFGLRIFNPDGSEAEKSGNGLRIFSRYLFDTGRVGEEAFKVDTPGGRVSCEVDANGRSISVEMGKVTFVSSEIPIAGPRRAVLDEEIEVNGSTYRFYGATVGNPHCVIPVEELSKSLAERAGPIIEGHPLFPNRTNVQFMKILDRHTIQIEIWERGAGYTLASGSSSCASAAVARKMGACNQQITVKMPGGELEVEISNDFEVRMTGPATRVAEMQLDSEALS
jgi:diaminopimelate epimerase